MQRFLAAETRLADQYQISSLFPDLGPIQLVGAK
jgi:hypothetical protein